MLKIKANRFIQALVKLMLLSAVLHILILVVHSVIVQNISELSLFKIIGLDLFYPELSSMFLFSSVVAFVIYVLIYFFFTDKN